MNPTEMNHKSLRAGISHQLIIIHIVLTFCIPQSHGKATKIHNSQYYKKNWCHFLCIIFALALKSLYLLFQQKKP